MDQRPLVAADRIPHLVVVVVDRDLAAVDRTHFGIRRDWEVLWQEHLVLAYRCWEWRSEVCRWAYLVYRAESEIYKLYK